MSKPCKECVWVSNSGRGGKPDYRPNRMMWGVRMHVLCEQCGCRTWLSPKSWAALPKWRKSTERRMSAAEIEAIPRGTDE